MKDRCGEMTAKMNSMTALAGDEAVLMPSLTAAQPESAYLSSVNPQKTVTPSFA